MIKKNLLSIIVVLSVILNISLVSFADTTSPPPSISPSPTAATPAPTPEPFPEVRAEGAIFMDMKTGREIYSKNPDEKLYPASTTKILTAIIALERGNLEEVITASRSAIDPITLEDSHMGIYVGEQFTLEQLINGMLIYSANDAANVIAVHLAGSIDEFANVMNEKAKEIGVVNSNFVNPHGFHNDNHYTTARDLATISRYAMKNEKFREIVKTTRYTIPATPKYKEDRILPTTNHLISKIRNSYHFYQPAIGIKTGYTSLAGNCLVSAAAKDGTEFLCVILKCTNANSKAGAYSFVDSTALFEYGFRNYKYYAIATNSDVVSDSAVYEAKAATRVALTVENEIGALLPVTFDKNTDIESNVLLNEKINAPIQEGQVLGSISYSYKGEDIGTSNLLAVNAVERDSLLFVIHGILNVITSPFFIIPIIAFAGLIIYIKIQRRKKRNKRRNRLSYPKRYK